MPRAAFISVFVLVCFTAGCSSVRVSNEPVRTTSSPSAVPEAPRFTFLTGLNIIPQKPSWHVERLPCIYGDEKAATQTPSAIFGLAGANLTSWAKSHLADATTQCVFAPNGVGFTVWVLSSRAPTSAEKHAIMEQIQPSLAEAMCQFLNSKMPRGEDLPNTAPDSNAVAKYPASWELRS